MMITRERLPDWELHLDMVLAFHRDGPFDWGVRDCATLFTGSVAALTGFDLRAGLPPWFSRNSALRSLAKGGYGSVRALAEAHLAAIHPSAASVGDVGFPDAPDALACPAIIIGAEAVSMQQDGWIVLPRSYLATAHRVG